MDEQYVMLTEPPSALENEEPFDLADLITEDDEPVDNFVSAKQQRLLVERSTVQRSSNVPSWPIATSPSMACPGPSRLSRICS